MGAVRCELQSLIEQACNYYLTHGCFPDTYEDMQPIPVLKVGILPYAGDDGGEHGQAYRLRLDLEGRCCYFAFRAPDQSGDWVPPGPSRRRALPLPDPVVERLQAGESLAPTLREIAEPDGTRYAVLDLIVEVPVTPLPDLKGVRRVLGWDWGVRTLVTATVLDLEGNRLSPPLFLDTGGFDGRQAHTRRHIDRLKTEGRQAGSQAGPVSGRRPEARALGEEAGGLAPGDRALLEEVRGQEQRPGPPGGQHADPACERVGSRPDCRQIPQVAEVGGPGTGSQGQVGALAQQLADPGSAVAHAALQMPSRGAAPGLAAPSRHDPHLPPLWQACSHLCLPCPRCPSAGCGSLAALFRVWLEWGQRLRRRHQHCAVGRRLSAAGHGAHSEQTPPKRPTMTTKSLNSESYTGSGLALRLPPTPLRGCLERGKMFVNGWIKSVTLHSAFSQETMLRLCG